ncbi:MAG TPA: MFS transporter [Actinomycetota bacterium]|jgi:MFS family permease|nr:MFS transporter [Actinomycetota bacterium]
MTYGKPSSARPALWILAAALVLAMSTWFSASAVIPQLRSEWALTAGTAAWLTIAVQIGFVAGAIMSATLNVADVLPARIVILGGAVGAGAANLMLLWAPDATVAIPARFLTGFFLSGVYPPALKLMATWFRTGRGVALGILVGALTLGSALPHLVNGAGGLDSDVVIVTTSALTFLGGMLATRVPVGPFPFPRAVFDPRQIATVMSNRNVRLASFGYFGHMWELYAMWTWFVVFFADGVGAHRAAPFAAFAAIGVGSLGCWAGGVLGDRWGRARTTIAMMAASGSCALLIGHFARGPRALLLAVALVWGFTAVADSAQFSTLVTELADQAYVGTALTLQLALGFTLTVATIWLIPLIERAVTWRWAFALLAPGPALGVVAMLRLNRLVGGR